MIMGIFRITFLLIMTIRLCLAGGNSSYTSQGNYTRNIFYNLTSESVNTVSDAAFIPDHHITFHKCNSSDAIPNKNIPMKKTDIRITNYFGSTIKDHTAVNNLMDENHKNGIEENKVDHFALDSIVTKSLNRKFDYTILNNLSIEKNYYDNNITDDESIMLPATGIINDSVNTKDISLDFRKFTEQNEVSTLDTLLLEDYINEESSREQFPYLATVLIMTKHEHTIEKMCMGVIASVTFVITSANCIHDYNTSDSYAKDMIWIDTGMRIFNQEERKENMYECHDIFFYSDYQYGVFGAHDIALIETENKINFYRYVKSAKLTAVLWPEDKAKFCNVVGCKKDYCTNESTTLQAVTARRGKNACACTKSNNVDTLICINEREICYWGPGAPLICDGFVVGIGHVNLEDTCDFKMSNTSNICSTLDKHGTFAIVSAYKLFLTKNIPDVKFYGDDSNSIRSSTSINSNSSSSSSSDGGHVTTKKLMTRLPTQVTRSVAINQKQLNRTVVLQIISLLSITLLLLQNITLYEIILYL